MAPYAPRDNEPVMFIAMPVKVQEKFESVLIFLITSKNINHIMNFRAGYGDTQEDYLVGEDNLMRSDSYLDLDKYSVYKSFLNPTESQVDTVAVQNAFNNTNGNKIVLDYRGVPVLSAYTTIKVCDDIRWAILSEIDKAEVMQAPDSIRNSIIIYAFVILIVVIFFTLKLMSINLIQPLTAFKEKIAEITTENNLSYRVSTNSSPEISQMAHSFNSLLHSLENEIEKNAFQQQKFLEQSRLAQMGEMISMIAHQWRQPLTAIGMIANNLSLDLEMDMYEKESSTKELELINKQVQFLSETIDNFRYFYKPNKEGSIQSIDKPIVQSLNIIRASLVSDGYEIVENYESTALIPLSSNEFMQVILNILKNAQDNFKEKSIKEGRITIHTQDQTEGVYIEICDNGGGIPNKVLPKIFDPYFSTKDAKNGTGLGLYMSKTIIEEHLHGKLDAINRDTGACFTIFLPNTPLEDLAKEEDKK